MSTELSRLDNLQIVSDQVGKAWAPEQIGVIQKSVAKDTTFAELAYFLNVCKTMELNPFNKEVWCYKDNRGNLLIFSGRDGFLSKAQKNPLFNGIRSAAVHKNDDFKMNIATGEVSHFPDFKQDRGDIIGAYAIVFRKNGEPTIEWAEWAAYNKGYNAWKTHPQEMIKKVAETHALKKAFGIAGIQSQYEYDIKDGAAVPKGTATDTDKLKTLQDLLDEKAMDISTDDFNAIQAIIDGKEEASYDKAIKALNNIKAENNEQ